MPLVILLFALFASLFTLSKSALELSEPFFLIGSRMGFAGILLILHQLIFYKQKLSFNQIPSLLLLGLTNIYLTNAAEIWGIAQMSSAKACLIYSLSPFIAAFIAYFVLKETLNAQKWVGLLIGFIGLIPITMIQNQNDVDQMVSLGGSFSWPEISMLVAVIASGYGWILLKKVITEQKITPLFANGVSMLFGGLLALLHSALIGEHWEPFPIKGEQYLPFLQISILMMVISNIICYNLYGYLLTRFSATFMSLAGLVTPLFASFFGWYFLKETISWHFFASMAIFSVGLYLFYQKEISSSASVSSSSN